MFRAVLDTQEEDPAMTDADLVPLVEALRLDLDAVDLDPGTFGRDIDIESLIFPANSTVEGFDAACARGS